MLDQDRRRAFLQRFVGFASRGVGCFGAYWFRHRRRRRHDDLLLRDITHLQDLLPSRHDSSIWCVLHCVWPDCVLGDFVKIYLGAGMLSPIH